MELFLVLERQETWLSPVFLMLLTFFMVLPSGITEESETKCGQCREEMVLSCARENSLHVDFWNMLYLIYLAIFSCQNAFERRKISSKYRVGL